jgi:hypothetical protein
MDLADRLRGKGLVEWTEPDEPAGMRVWVSEPEEAGRALSRFQSLQRELGPIEAALFLTTEAAAVPENFALEERIGAFLTARNEALEPLPEPDWLDAAIDELTEKQILAAIERARRTRVGKPEATLSLPVVIAGEGPLLVVVHDGRPEWGPLPVGWMWDARRSASVAVLWESWAAQLGFRPVIAGAQSLGAQSTRIPEEPALVRELVRQFLTLCPEYAEGDVAPARAALRDVLSAAWSFAWD